MPKLSTLQGRSIYNSAGKRLGSVTHLLFHPSEPVLVGYEVRRKPLLHLVPMPLRYITREQLSASEGRLIVEGKRLPMSASLKSAGYTWDDTVIWSGMPVYAEDGIALGTVGDLTVSLKTGRVTKIIMTGGTTADIAIGRREIEGDLLVGFDRDRLRVVLYELPDDVGYSGGAAAVAGKGIAVAKVRTEQAVTRAATYGAATIAVAGKSKTGRTARALWHVLSDSFQKAVLPEEDR